MAPTLGRPSAHTPRLHAPTTSSLARVHFQDTVTTGCYLFSRCWDSGAGSCHLGEQLGQGSHSSSAPSSPTQPAFCVRTFLSLF